MQDSAYSSGGGPSVPRMNEKLQEFIEETPINSVILIILALVGGIDLCIDGDLSDDFAIYAGIIGTTSGLTAIGKGIRKQGLPTKKPRV